MMMTLVGVPVIKYIYSRLRHNTLLTVYQDQVMYLASELMSYNVDELLSIIQSFFKTMVCVSSAFLGDGWLQFA